MRDETQDKCAIKLIPTAELRRRYPNEGERIYAATGYVAEALRRLAAAGQFGVHVDEIRRDALARFDQLDIRYECFSAPRRGTGDKPVWVRLNFGNLFDVSVMGSAA